MTITLKVKNWESYTVSTKVRLILDRSRSASYDFDSLSGPKNISAGGTAEFSFTFTPSNTGDYYAYGIINGSYNGAYIPTDQWPWPLKLTVDPPPKGDLAVTMYDVNGTTKSASIGGTTWGRLTHADFFSADVFVEFVDGQSVAFWSGLDPGRYNLRVYHDPDNELDLTEFWGSKTLDVIANMTNVSSFTRETQKFGDFPETTGTLNQPVTITVDVKNWEERGPGKYIGSSTVGSL